ncbi:hypothetical protein SEA_CAMBIARE_6 [Mycobacterium phage Cambiare]|uniref:Uncharacterized protein n=2 Tax=Avocadovirus TaxID=2946813 RepID=A0A222YZT6_9CAUD|nr:hypothetical protein AVT48_gp06 [Mycobacterium phage Cambiare]YP_010051477.1 hypothetical protein KDW73_gp05 [Mycobacterium phage Avocado]AKF14508.1 hypothetical protein SEA_CAMBIARE_6 [Mycobacterium phage Cambiare]ASR77207.1 hypothetical protein SEA_AVOCADO_5 [Mycobacterium phage Avocado]
MTFREEAVEALRAGQNSKLGDPNPYGDDRPLLRRVWFRGHMSMLEIRTAASPARQAFLRGDVSTG